MDHYAGILFSVAVVFGLIGYALYAKSFDDWGDS